MTGNRLKISLNKCSLLLLILLTALALLTGFFPFTVRAAGADAGENPDALRIATAAAVSVNQTGRLILRMTDETVPIVTPYSFSGNSWRHPPYPEVRYRINENTADCEGEGAAVQAAAAAWSASGANFSFVYDGASGASGSSNNGVNDICWGSLSDGTVALSSIWYNPDTLVISECDLVFNDNYNWSSSDTPDNTAYDIQTLALHELGHFLMLNDLYRSEDRDKAMYGIAIPGWIKRALHPDDIAGIRDVYGAAASPAVPAGGADNAASGLNGEVIPTGGADPAFRIYWDAAGGKVSINWTYDISLGMLSAGVFYIGFAGLSPDCAYYCRCYAYSTAGGSWAAAVSLDAMM
jgi:hypothetical protein